MSEAHVSAEAPPADFTHTAEFQSSVAAAVQASIADLLPGIIAKLTPAGAASPSTLDANWAEQLSMAIAKLTDQGDKRFVPPDVLRFREKSRKRMIDLIVDARAQWSEAKARGDAARAESLQPTYRLRNKVFLDEQLIEPMWIDTDHRAKPTIIGWPGVPNDAMEPQNECAKAIFAAFKDSVGNVGEKDPSPVPKDKLHTTYGGLVVKTRPPAHELRQVGGAYELHPAGGPESVVIKHKPGQGEYETINVLGNVAAPARQRVA